MTTTSQAAMTTGKPLIAQSPEKQRRSFSVSLHDAAGSAMRIIAVRRNDGSAITFAIHTTKDAAGKKTAVRGASEKHADIDTARAAATKLTRAAVNIGWTLREGRGFQPRADAFDAAHLPAPAATRAAKKK